VAAAALDVAEQEGQLTRQLKLTAQVVAVVMAS
jgi:hypothetical protein